METNTTTKETLISSVERYYGVTMKEMCVRNTQKYPVAAARDLLCYMLREICGLKYAKIAEIFDTTLRNIFHRIRKTKQDLSSKGKLYKDYQEIINLI